MMKDGIKLKDIYFTILLFGIFVLWLRINKQNLVGNLKLIHDSLLYGKDNTPFMAFIKNFQKNFKELRII